MVTVEPPCFVVHPKRDWRVDVKTTERYEWEIYDEMKKWLRGNVKRSRYAIVMFLRGGRSIKHVGFKDYADATLFYLRFA